MARFRAGRSGRSAVLIGAGELERKFLALEESVQAHTMMKGLEEGGDVLLREMQARAPKESGDLADSLDMRSKIKGRRAEVEVGALDSTRSGRYYAPFIELGYKRGDTHIPAQPFMRPALHATTRSIVNVVGDFVKSRIARLARGAG